MVKFPIKFKICFPPIYFPACPGIFPGILISLYYQYQKNTRKTTSPHPGWKVSTGEHLAVVNAKQEAKIVSRETSNTIQDENFFPFWKNAIYA